MTGIFSQALVIGDVGGPKFGISPITSVMVMNLDRRSRMEGVKRSLVEMRFSSKVETLKASRINKDRIIMANMNAIRWSFPVFFG